MQCRVIEKEAKDRGPQFAGKLLDMVWTVKLWLNQQDPDSDLPIFVKDVPHEYSRHDKPEHLIKQDLDIDKFLGEESKIAIDAYLNEESLMVDEHITGRTSTLVSKLETDYGEI